MTPLEEYCVCTQCGKNFTDGHHKTCDSCRERQKEKYRAHPEWYKPCAKRWTRKAREEGRCIACGKPVVPGKAYCLDHYVKRRKFDADRNQMLMRKRHDMGIGTTCVTCRKPLPEGRKRYCYECGKLQNLRLRGVHDGT